MLRTLMTTLALSIPAHAAGGLSLAWEAEPRTVDPRFAVDANSQYLENLIHCALIDFDQDGRAVPDLAKSWVWASPTSLKVELNPLAKFSDGSRVTAADVKATYESVLRKDVKNPSPRQGSYAKLKSIKTPSEDSLVFDLTEPDSTFVLNLVIGILPGKTASLSDMLTPDQAIVSCGPFVLKAFANNAITLGRNDHYSLDALPKADRITIKIVKDETTRYAKLQAGEIDIVQNAIGRDKLKDIAKKNPALKVLRRPGLNTVYLGFNMKDPLVGQLAVRQAIAHAIDRNKVIQYVLNGLAVPATTLMTPNDPFVAKHLSTPALDLTKAKQILDEAGFKDPDGDGKASRFALSYKTTTDQTRIAIAKAIAADLRKIGIDVTVESLEWGRFKADIEAGKVQMWSLQWIGFKDPDVYRFAFATESFPPNGGNRGFYSNAELDQLLAQGRTENDVLKRVATYTKVQEIIHRELPYIFLWHEEIFAVLNGAVEGFELFADGRFASLQHAYRK